MRLLLVFLVLTITTTACGHDSQTEKERACAINGDRCHDGEDNRTQKPQQGIRGEAGKTGPQGSQGSAGTPGSNGSDGATGPAGAPGADGSSCSAQAVVGGVLITCTDGTSAVLLNGTNGTDGQDGQDAEPTPYEIVGEIDPCGHQVAFDEILLRLANNQIVAHYASGSLQFLTRIYPGNYVVTDGSHCYFTVNADMSISNEHN